MSVFPALNRNIIKSKGQQLKDATLKIGELEREKKWLTERVSYLVVAVSALGQHANLTAQEASKVIQDFIKEKEVDMQQQVEVAKEKFKENLANGIMPTNFTIQPNENNDAPKPE